MTKPIFKWESKVRDYELDSQGVVNHSTYLNYLEQTRSEYAHALGIDFIEYYKAGYLFVVAGLEIEYHRSLVFGNEFYVTVYTKSFNEKRMDFAQEVRRKSDDKLMVSATVHVACMDVKTKKSCMPEMLSKILQTVVS